MEVEEPVNIVVLFVKLQNGKKGDIRLLLDDHRVPFLTGSGGTF